MKMIIEIPDEAYKAIEKIRFLIGGRYARKLQQTVINAIKNGKPLPENNIGVIQTLFPDAYFLSEFPFEFKQLEKVYLDHELKNLSHLMVSQDWCNAKYGEADNEQTN